MDKEDSREGETEQAESRLIGAVIFVNYAGKRLKREDTIIAAKDHLIGYGIVVEQEDLERALEAAVERDHLRVIGDRHVPTPEGIHQMRVIRRGRAT